MLNIIITLILILSSVIYYKLADKFNIIDKPNHRSSHTTPIIRGGGVVFLFALLAYWFVSGFNHSYFILGSLLIASVSFIDDLITLSSKLRFPFQLIAIVLLLVDVFGFQESLYIYIPLVIVGVGFINLYNFMDGINGITGLYSLVVLLLFYCLNVKIKAIDDTLIIYSIMSVLVFGYYNFRKKAMMFAGDIGSICIAMLIFFIGVKLIFISSNIIIILSVLVYSADNILTIIYRKMIGENILEAHRHHIYQKLVDRTNMSHLQVSFSYALLQLLVGLIVMFNLNESLVTQLSIIVVISVIFILGYVFLFKLLERVK